MAMAKDMMAGAGTLYFLCGRAGAGKTTLARKIGNQRRAILFCEDQWLTRLFGGASNLAEYVERRGHIRQLLAEHVPAILKAGHSVVFDFGGNTVRDRLWVRSLFESAGAAHELHYLLADDATCKQRIIARNRTQPDGLYWGDVSEEMFDAVNKYFQPPTADEGFVVFEREAKSEV